MPDIRAKENFVSHELVRVLRKIHSDVKEAWYAAENGNEYVYIELTCGQIRRVDVTGDGVAAILLDVAYALD